MLPNRKAYDARFAFKKESLKCRFLHETDLRKNRNVPNHTKNVRIALLNQFTRVSLHQLITANSKVADSLERNSDKYDRYR
jgi:hypothetical protein